jgi:HAMP domain-containing protein/predicted Ser/Thr protein kinase
VSLTQKILAFVSALVLGLLLTTLVYTTFQANRLARESLREGLSQTTGIWETFQADRYDKLKLGLRALANEPAFKAVVEARDLPTIQDTLAERGADFGADLFVVTDANGSVLSRAGRAGREGTDLSHDPLILTVLDGQEAATIWKEGTRLYHTVAVPMATGGALQGILIAGFALDERLASDIRKLTRSEIAFFANDAGAWKLSASTIGETSAALDRAAEPRAEPVTVSLSNAPYLAVSAPLRSASGEVVGSIAALRSVDQEMAPFRRFRYSLIGASLVALVCGLGAAYAVSSGITRPVRRLVDLVDRVREGSFTGAVQVTSRDEIGTLARAFNALLADLREKEQLITYLRDDNAAAHELRATGSGNTPTLLQGDATSVRPDATLGGLASRYEILETLGKGGMGVVFRARDRKLDEIVALKTLRPEVLATDRGLLERFKQELKLARRITHKNVMRTYDFGEEAGAPYITMEYVEGVTLKDLVKSRGALPLSVGLRIAKEMCHGLEAAHAQGVVHRDIKAQNMMIIPASGALKIMDFGIARQTDVSADGEPGLTVAGMVMGTPDYMPPEQAQGLPADFRSDIYSLGIVLFEAFTGKLPFRGSTVLGTLAKQVNEPAPSLRSLNPSIPANLEAAVLRCLAKDPAARYQSVAELLADLDSVSAGTA